jgi:WD40 repeat protein
MTNTDSVAQEKLINEEYKIWKKNSPFLYDLVITHALEWPTLTAQFFPDSTDSSQRLLLGTHTSEGAQNHLMFGKLDLPLKGSKADYSNSGTKFTITQKINHDGEVNRARYMPSNPDIIATRTFNGPVYIFDRTKHSSVPSSDGICNPDIKLIGHSKEGYGMSWHLKNHGHLLTASEDTTIHHWDITAFQKNKTLNPTRVYTGHTAWVEDVAWSPLIDTVFASVGDDKKLLMFFILILAGILAPNISIRATLLSKHTRQKSIASPSTQKMNIYWPLALRTRLLLCGICAISNIVCTLLNPTRTKSFSSPGPPTMKLSWHRPAVIAD